MDAFVELWKQSKTVPKLTRASIPHWSTQACVSCVYCKTKHNSKHVQNALKQCTQTVKTLEIELNWITILQVGQSIDLMHMTSQKGAQGSNVALPRAPSPSMQPEGQPLHAILHTAGLARGPRTDWEAERQCALPAQHVRAARQVLTPNMASLLWRRDVNA